MFQVQFNHTMSTLTRRNTLTFYFQPFESRESQQFNVRIFTW